MLALKEVDHQPSKTLEPITDPLKIGDEVWVPKNVFSDRDHDFVILVDRAAQPGADGYQSVVGRVLHPFLGTPGEEVVALLMPLRWVRRRAETSGSISGDYEKGIEDGNWLKDLKSRRRAGRVTVGTPQADT